MVSPNLKLLSTVALLMTLDTAVVNNARYGRRQKNLASKSDFECTALMDPVRVSLNNIRSLNCY